jgi:hypothetical protein
MTKKMLSVAFATALAAQAYANPNSPWTLEDESSELTFHFVRQDADRFFAGNAEMALPGNLRQDTSSIEFSYGISNQLSLDVQVGYTKSDFPVVPGLAPNGGLSGLQDARLGLRYNIMGAENDLPTVTFGLAALIDGSYDTGALPAVGDGESGVELSVLVGHAFESGFLLSGSYARRQYNGDVPDNNVFNLGAGYAFTDRFSGGVFYQDVSANGDLNIGGPGFSPARFPEVDEEFSLWGVGGSFAVTDAWVLGLDYGRKNDGKNTAKSDFLSLSVSYLF